MSTVASTDDMFGNRRLYEVPCGKFQPTGGRGPLSEAAFSRNAGGLSWWVAPLWWSWRTCLHVLYTPTAIPLELRPAAARYLCVLLVSVLCFCAVCVGQPSAYLLNGDFPRSCASTPVGGTCTAVCNKGYGGPAPATIKCVADPTSKAGARWEAEATGVCDKGEPAVVAPTAECPLSLVAKVIEKMCLSTQQ
jgi:hypothetical protein